MYIILTYKICLVYIVNYEGRFGVAKVKSRLGVSVSGLVPVRLDDSDDNRS